MEFMELVEFMEFIEFIGLVGFYPAILRPSPLEISQMGIS